MKTQSKKSALEAVKEEIENEVLAGERALGAGKFLLASVHFANASEVCKDLWSIVSSEGVGQ